ncbi:unnamed protein product, partial [Adineta ricciae]
SDGESGMRVPIAADAAHEEGVLSGEQMSMLSDVSLDRAEKSLVEIVEGEEKVAGGKKKEKSISPETSMNINEVIETIRLEDELLEPKKTFEADIVLPNEDDVSKLTEISISGMPCIPELPQTLKEEISVNLSRLESVPSDQAEEQVKAPSVTALDKATQNKLPQVSLAMDDTLVSSSVEREKLVEPTQVTLSQVVDYIEIPTSKTDLPEHKPEAIIITE